MRDKRTPKDVCGEAIYRHAYCLVTKTACINKHYKVCENADYVSAWRTVELETESQQRLTRNRATRSETVVSRESIFDKGAPD